MSSQKDENIYIAKVNKLLRNVHFEKTYNPLRKGMPDMWYSGPKADLWVEYKFVEKLPVHVPFTPNLSDLQQLWLNRRYDEGRNVAVVVGTGVKKDKGLILIDGRWNSLIIPKDLPLFIVCNKDIASWIACFTGGNLKQ